MMTEAPEAMVKVIEVVGSSEVSFSDAAINAVRVTALSTRDIKSVEVLASSAEVAPEREHSLYTMDCRITFIPGYPSAAPGD